MLSQRGGFFVRMLLAICMCTILLLSTVPAYAHRYPDRPPLPQEDMEKQVHEIIITDENQLKTLIERIKYFR